MKMIFVCYRRLNSHAAGRISDRLMRQYGLHSVFRDVGAIPDGATFRDTILAAVSAADTVLVIIANGWLGGMTRSNRLFDQNDFVRQEIDTALRQGIPVIPVLIDDAEMPQPEDLPSEIRSLVGLQFARVRDSDFDRDVERLLETIASVEMRKRIDIPVPASGDPVTAEHLVLKHTSWRMSRLDSDGKRVFGFGVVLDGDPSVLDRVNSVLYLLPPAWPRAESPKRVGRDVPRFEFKNLSWSDLVVRARVYIRDQGMPVFLSAFVRLTETGPRTHEIA